LPVLLIDQVASIAPHKTLLECHVFRTVAARLAQPWRRASAMPIQLAAKKPLYNFISLSFVFDNNRMKIKDNILLAYTLL